MRKTAALFVAAAVVSTGAASYFAFASERPGTLAFWGLAAAPGLVLGIAAAFWAHREDFLGEWLTPRWGDATLTVLAAAALYVLAWSFVRVAAPVGSRHEVWLVPLYEQLGDPRVLRAHAPWVAAWLGLASLGEELVWRGVATQLLAQRVGSRTAWLWAAALYALAYAPTAWALGTGLGPNPILVVAAAGGGLFWGALVRTTGRVLPAALAHALFDCAVVMMLPLWGPYAMV